MVPRDKGARGDYRAVVRDLRRAVLALFGAVSLASTGCAALLETRACDATSSTWLAPMAKGPVEVRRFEAPPPRPPVLPKLRAQKSFFDETGFAREIWPSLRPLSAPDFEGVLVCAVSASPRGDIDGVTLPTPVGDANIPVGTADLMIWARFGAIRKTAGPLIWSNGGVFAFKVPLRTNDEVVFTLGDFDFFSPNDYIGELATRYPGKLPFSFQGNRGAATCRGVDRAGLDALAEETRRAMERELAVLEGHVPTLDKPIEQEALSRLGWHVTRLGYLGSETDPAILKAQVRIERAGEVKWTKYLELLGELRSRLPEPERWVPVSPSFRAHVIGLVCRKHSYGEACSVGIDVELPPSGGTLCPIGAASAAGMGPFRAVHADGQVYDLRIDHVQIDGAYLPDDTALEKLAGGQVVRVLLSIPTYTRYDEPWSYPLLRIGDVWLRAY